MTTKTIISPPKDESFRHRGTSTPRRKSGSLAELSSTRNAGKDTPPTTSLDETTKATIGNAKDAAEGSVSASGASDGSKSDASAGHEGVSSPSSSASPSSPASASSSSSSCETDEDKHAARQRLRRLGSSLQSSLESTEGLSEYELLRLRNIQRNEARMAELGLLAFGSKNAKPTRRRRDARSNKRGRDESKNPSHHQGDDEGARENSPAKTSRPQLKRSARDAPQYTLQQLFAPLDRVINGTSPPPKRWEDRYAELQRYHSQHGHVKVPFKSPNHNDRSLARWLSAQKTQLAFLRDGKKTYLTDDKIHLLESLGVQPPAPNGKITKHGNKHHWSDDDEEEDADLADQMRRDLEQESDDEDDEGHKQPDEYDEVDIGSEDSLSEQSLEEYHRFSNKAEKQSSPNDKFANNAGTEKNNPSETPSSSEKHASRSFHEEEYFSDLSFIVNDDEADNYDTCSGQESLSKGNYFLKQNRQEITTKPHRHHDKKLTHAKEERTNESNKRDTQQHTLEESDLESLSSQDDSLLSISMKRHGQHTLNFSERENNRKESSTWEWKKRIEQMHSNKTEQKLNSRKTRPKPNRLDERSSSTKTNHGSARKRVNMRSQLEQLSAEVQTNLPAIQKQVQTKKRDVVEDSSATKQKQRQINHDKNDNEALSSYDKQSTLSIPKNMSRDKEKIDKNKCKRSRSSDCDMNMREDTSGPDHDHDGQKSLSSEGEELGCSVDDGRSNSDRRKERTHSASLRSTELPEEESDNGRSSLPSETEESDNIVGNRHRSSNRRKKRRHSASSTSTGQSERESDNGRSSLPSETEESDNIVGNRHRSSNRRKKRRHSASSASTGQSEEESNDGRRPFVVKKKRSFPRMKQSNRSKRAKRRYNDPQNRILQSDEEPSDDQHYSPPKKKEPKSVEKVRNRNDRKRNRDRKVRHDSYYSEDDERDGQHLMTVAERRKSHRTEKNQKGSSRRSKKRDCGIERSRDDSENERSQEYDESTCDGESQDSSLQSEDTSKIDEHYEPVSLRGTKRRLERKFIMSESVHDFEYMSSNRRRPIEPRYSRRPDRDAVLAPFELNSSPQKNRFPFATISDGREELERERSQLMEEYGRLYGRRCLILERKSQLERELNVLKPKIIGDSSSKVSRMSDATKKTIVSEGSSIEQRDSLACQDK